MRLDNLLAQEKVSRKTMKQALLKEEILVDSCPARSLAQNIDTGLHELLFQGRIVQGYEHSYLMLHKPAGVVTANKDKELPTIMGLLPPDIQSDKLYAVGRLDRDTTGLLILTDNGPLGFQLLHPQYHVDKTYQVEVNGLLTPDHIQTFQKGIVFLDGTICKPARLEILSASPSLSQGSITISEGKFHQIKKMFLSVGVKVTSLKRTHFGPWSLDENLQEGDYRPLNSQELASIREFLRKSG
ncbi:ribosomal small subunit pseudouridine synthase A [Streptococcus pneumoniae]|uniref:16S rRNA pseudouridine(516) synthase n=1 Tax=Streptococcus pneumoniae TaxID=1313 RepID=UPI0005DCB383|nr:16S rRNA pseudouridine(516) synthase [Streptococcus pneumoniae]CIQ35044.1 ribosomal small subunit pseudouridine synthase A [Streptococcus pneumoniae]CJM28148.1 ribosomal small subunit pseudouridine synthase A [Streptococcus pneumoniae]CKJ09989.1 ribosomal small subunit pseudouridine synthase A [Streptococcus pneumoniae]CKJ20941.1 ribosomal small subunit pseudouridine synthase A [Streptococcus pneumoniae]CKL41685.1 ribosomal small subunit pseudouridine synthase A [Streptococcus pneumoniae]